MTRRNRALSAVTWMTLSGILVGSGAHGEELLPDDPGGWIRHWVVYGPISFFPEGQLADLRRHRHPLTLDPLHVFDWIAEAPGTENRQTEANFLPAPGKEIRTEFPAILPGHGLREGAGPGINPNFDANGTLMGIPWGNCGCTVNFDRVFNFRSHNNDIAGPDDPVNLIAYAYTYVENIGEEPLDVYISTAWGDSMEVVLGAVPETPGTSFMEPVLLFDTFQPGGRDCVEQYGPDPDDPNTGTHHDAEKTVRLQPGLNLVLAKVLDGPGGHDLRFRFRHNNPPDYTPVTRDHIRIRLSPDPDAPDPALFRRADVNADGAVNLTDSVSLLEALFGGGEQPGCFDAADANDDGILDLTDAIYVLQHLFQGGSARIPFPRNCPGLDPTLDELPECNG